MSGFIPYSGGSAPPKSFINEVAKGNIPGHEMIGITARNPSVALSFVDLWNANVPHVEATANEQWEISSTSANDTILGTGAHTVLRKYVDENYELHIDTVQLDGVNWVPMTSDNYRSQSLVVETAGALNRNDGVITVRSVGSGNIQGQIPYLAGDRGLSVDQDGHYSIPAGKTGYGIDVIPFYAKGEDGFVRSILQRDGAVQYTGAILPFYQSGVPIPINAPFSLPEKTDINFQACSTNAAGTPVTITTSILLVDNTLVRTSQVLAARGFF